MLNLGFLLDFCRRIGLLMSSKCLTKKLFSSQLSNKISRSFCTSFRLRQKTPRANIGRWTLVRLKGRHLQMETERSSSYISTNREIRKRCKPRNWRWFKEYRRTNVLTDTAWRSLSTRRATSTILRHTQGKNHTSVDSVGSHLSRTVTRKTMRGAIWTLSCSSVRYVARNSTGEYSWRPISFRIACTARTSM